MAPKKAAPRAQMPAAKATAKAGKAVQKKKEEEEVEELASSSKGGKLSGLELIQGGAAEPLGKKAADALRYELVKLEKAGKPEVRAGYRRCRTDKERKEFALRLQLDPTGAWLSVEESSSASVAKKKARKSGWFSLWEVAKEEGI
eukprot:13347551-Alexandrium_andersonii.AAC.1